MSVLRFGIVGAGSYGPVHARAIAGLDGARLVAVTDVLPERASAVAGELGCAVSPDLAALCARADIDAVTISVPHALHADAVLVALRAGKHVLVEKPLEINLAAADRIIAEERRTGRTVALMSQRRFEPRAQAVKAAIDAGEFGRLTSGAVETTTWRPQSYYDSTPWRGTLAVEGGGALMTLGVHALDLLLWFMGEPVAVQAQSACLAHERIEVEDVLTGSVRFASGALATVSVSTAANPGRPGRVVVDGDRSGAQILDDEAAAAGFDARAAMREQYRDFLESVATRRAPAIGTQDGRRVLATVLALYESARTGETVRLAQPDATEDGG